MALTLPQEAGAQTAGTFEAWSGRAELNPAELPSSAADVDSLVRAARRAHDQKDEERAERLWRAVVAVAPDNQEAWNGAGVAMRGCGRHREAADWLDEARLRFPQNIRIAENRAWTAMALRDWGNAERIWRETIRDFPDHPGAYIGLSYLLRVPHRAGEYETLMVEARKQFPGRRDFEMFHAAAAGLRQDWQEAALRYKALKDARADDPEVAIRLAEALRRAQQVDEGERVVARAVEDFPGSIDVAIAFAQYATDRRFWPVAIARWDRAIQKFPNNPASFAGLGVALRSAELFACHEVILNDAANRFPDNEGILIERARLWPARGDWEAAAVHSEQLANKYPNSPDRIAEYGFALARACQFDRAHLVLNQGLERFPNHFELRFNLARVAEVREDWAEALRQFSVLHAEYRHDQRVNLGLGVARYHMSLCETPAEAALPAVPSGQGASAARRFPHLVDPAAFISKFHSLGQNCEFGLLQRELGAEPLGLLRFSFIYPRHLLTALKSRFDGVGGEEFTTLRISGSEYLTGDRRYGMTMHTHIAPKPGDFDNTFAKLRKQLSFLKRKLIEDLEAGEKIFVYKNLYDGMDDALLAQLCQAIAAYGTPKLFLVKRQAPGKPDGHVDIVDDRTLVGYIDRDGYDGSAWNIPYESWISLCCKAADYWKIPY